MAGAKDTSRSQAWRRAVLVTALLLSSCATLPPPPAHVVKLPPTTVTLIIDLPVKVATACKAGNALSEGAIKMSDHGIALPTTRIPPYAMLNFALPDVTGKKQAPKLAFEEYTVARDLVAASASIYRSSLNGHTIPTYAVPCSHTIKVQLSDDDFQTIKKAMLLEACPNSGPILCIDLPMTISTPLVGLMRSAAADQAITLSEQKYLN